MKLKRIALVAAAAVFVGATGWGLQIAKAGEKIAIGAEMPDFELKGTDGKSHKLSDFKGKIVALQFASQDCPWSKGADPDISALAKAYADKDVVVLGIEATSGRTMEAVAEYNKDRDLAFVTLLDEGNVYADAVNAKQTPEFFVVDNEGKLAYHGAFDDRTQPTNAGDVNYVAKAVDSLLAGTAVEEPEVKAWGCGIKRGSRTGS